MTRTRIGIDVGGTTTRAAVVDDQGNVLDRQDVPTLVDTPLDTLVDQWSGLIQNLAKASRAVPPRQRAAGFSPRGSSNPAVLRDHARSPSSVDSGPQEKITIGLAVAGLLDPDRRVVLRSVNLPMLEGPPLGEMLELATGTKVTLLTDIEAATGAEWRAHVAPGGRFVHLRIGTGIGCGMVREGKFIEPERSAAGHADVLIIEDGGEAAVCACGRRGCLEAYASGAALIRRARELGLPTDLAALRSARRHGDQRALELLAQTADKLALGIRRIAQVLSPEVVCLGGGVVELCPELVEGVFTRPCAVPIMRARLGDDAGVIGAATHCTYST